MFKFINKWIEQYKKDKEEAAKQAKLRQEEKQAKEQQRLKLLEEAETQRRKFLEDSKRNIFILDIRHVFTKSDIENATYLVDDTKEGIKPIHWLVRELSSFNLTRQLNLLLSGTEIDLEEEFEKQATLYYNNPVNKLMVECLDGLKKIPKDVYFGRFHFNNQIRNTGRIIIDRVAKDLLKKAIEESTLTWPTYKEVVESGKFRFDYSSLPSHWHKYLPDTVEEDFAKRWEKKAESLLAKTFGQDKTEGSLMPSLRDDYELPERPYNEAVREQAIKYLAASMIDCWSEILSKAKQAHYKFEEKAREDHLKRHNVSRQKSLSVGGPRLSKRFPVTRSIR